MDDFNENDNDKKSETSETSSEDSKPDKMMSMFSSYYGMEIEDNNTETVDEEETDEIEKENVQIFEMMQIDSPIFNANLYIREMLLNKNNAELLSEDTRMTHEIRALDSDMQMLVYENYNKFISATETIKRMKNNVEFMEHDMNAVKDKTINLSENAIKLENALQGKRSEVDKLVKIRKLLLKLEFLSELPEKLSRMIQQEKYKQAVELYNQTITVLTKHSNVLSFRNIQTKTEKMMKDLRIMVTGLLDKSNNLDVIKLTQYVATLRLMEAPKKQVIEKFISAHTNRWIQLVSIYEKENLHIQNPIPISTLKSIHFIDINNYKNNINNKKNINIKDIKDIKDNKDDICPTLTQLRQFHQFIISGLLEACKGVKEMFQKDASIHTNTNINKINIKSPEDIIKENIILEQEAIEAHELLQQMIKKIIAIYTNAVIISLQRFFISYNKFIQQNIHLAQANFQLDNGLASCSISECNNNNNNNNNENHSTTSNSAPISEHNSVTDQLPIDGGINEAINKYKQELAVWNEERSKWILLMRQMIIEVQLLDDAVADCRCFEYTIDFNITNDTCNINDKEKENKSKTVIVTNMYEHSEYYSQLLLELVVDSLNIYSIQYHVDLFTYIYTSCIPQFIKLSYLKEELEYNLPTILSNKIMECATQLNKTDNNNNNNNIHSKQNILTHCRSILSNRSNTAQQWQNLISDSFFQCFSMLCMEIKPLLDIIIILKGNVVTNKPSIDSITNLYSNYMENVKIIKKKLDKNINNNNNNNNNKEQNLLILNSNINYNSFYFEYNNKLLTNLTLLFGYQLRNVNQYVSQYCRAITFRLEYTCDLSYKNIFIPSTNLKYMDENIDGDWDCSIYEELSSDYKTIVNDTNNINNINNKINNKNKEDDIEFYNRMNNEMTMKKEKGKKLIKGNEYTLDDCLHVANKCKFSSLIGHFLLRKIWTDSFVSKLNFNLRDHDLSPITSKYQQYCIDYIVKSCRRLLVHYNESCVIYSNLLLCTHVMYYNNKMMSKLLLQNNILEIELEDWALKAEAFHRGEIAVSNSSLSLIYLMDILSVFNCIIFEDTPPNMKSIPNIDNRNNIQNINSRNILNNNNKINTSNLMRRSSVGLQQDIERLFSEKIIICNYDSVVTSPGNTSVMNIIAKVILKAFQEHLRIMHFHSDSNSFTTNNYGSFIMLQLQVDLLFFKQACTYLLKDVSETDRLTENCLTILINRCCTRALTSEEDLSMVNKLDNVNGLNEINRAVTDAMFKISKTSLIIGK